MFGVAAVSLLVVKFSKKKNSDNKNSDFIAICFVCNAEFPFEFGALEVALETICSFLDARTRDVENEVYPALDELTSKVRTLFTQPYMYLGV